jgi:hypothetical protein
MLVLLIVFALLAAAFAVGIYIPQDIGIRDGVHVVSTFTRAPDEARHIGNILYYAERPILNGPFISDPPDKSIWLGEITRFPSYLYYYVMSFPARLLLAGGASFGTLVIALRLFSLVAGILNLIIFRKTLRAIGFSLPVASVATLGLAFTGEFMWLSAAVTYDMWALLLFLVFIFSAVTFMNERSARYGAIMILALLVVSVTKYTYFPFALAGAIGVFLIVAIRDRSAAARATWRESLRNLLTGRVTFVLLAIAIAIALVLFVERVVVNFFSYGDVDPDCDVVRSDELCRGYDIYGRNTSNRERIADGIASGEIVKPAFAPLSYTGKWLEIYYRSTYFYSGHANGSWQVNQTFFIAGASLMLLVLVALIVNRQRIISTASMAYVYALVGLYAIGVYLFNVKTFTIQMTTFAHSGRYLLVFWAFTYAIAAVVLVRLVRRLGARSRFLGLPVVIVVVIVALIHSAPVSFLITPDSSTWFSGQALDILRLVLHR